MNDVTWNDAARPVPARAEARDGFESGRRRRSSAIRGASRALSVLLACVAAASAGCWRPPIAMDAERDRGLVWIFPGIEGGEWSVHAAYRALRDSGVNAEIRVYNWWRLNPLANLTDHELNRQRAGEIADEIATFRVANPAAPIDLLGYSGGGGLALFALEALSERVRVRNVVLAQAAVSPDYDLTAALTHIDGRLVNYYSPLDAVILGLGTSVFGTMDRQNVPAAGAVGFNVERAVPDESLRNRLVQEAWQLDSLLAGHPGTHAGKGEYGWNKRFVAPYLASADRDYAPALEFAVHTE